MISREIWLINEIAYDAKKYINEATDLKYLSPLIPPTFMLIFFFQISGVEIHKKHSCILSGTTSILGLSSTVSEVFVARMRCNKARHEL